MNANMKVNDANEVKSGLNLDLIIPVVMFFVILRTKSIFNIGHYLLKGLRLFITTVPSSSAAATTSTTSETKSTDEIIELSLAKLQLTMIEIDDSNKSKQLIESQLLYPTYEVMIYLTLGSSMAYLWSILYHGFYPTSPHSCWVFILLMVTILFNLHSLLQIIYLTGIRAIETKIAILFGCFTFVINLIGFLLKIHIFDEGLIISLSIHLKAMLLQISSSSIETIIPSDLLLKFLIEILITIIISLISTCFIFPSIRFGQSFLLITTSATTTTTTVTTTISKTTKYLLWMSLFLPGIISLCCSPIPYLIYDYANYNDTSASLLIEDHNNEVTMKRNNNLLFESCLLNIQILIILLTICIQMKYMKIHLQCFLDSLIKTVSEAMIAGQHANISLLHLKVKACTDYLIAAAIQYMTIPILLFIGLIILHKSSPFGTGVNYLLMKFLSPERIQDHMEQIYNIINYNSTAEAIKRSNAPYLSQVFNSMLGGQEIEAMKLTGVTDSSHLLPAFANKLSQVYFLPTRVAIPFCRGLLCIISLQWFLLYIIGIIMWKYYSHILLRTTQKQQEGKQQ